MDNSIFNRIIAYRKFLTTGHERSVRAKKNIIASLLIKGVNIGISLILVPLTLNYLNPSNYGIWLTLSSMVMWISFFDIGFTQGLRNKFAIAKAQGDAHLARIYISTTYFYISIIFIGLWLFLLIVNYYVNWNALINIPVNQENEISNLVVIIVSYFCLQFIFKIINTILFANQNPAIASFLEMLGQLISLGIIFLLATYTKGSLIYLGLAMGISPTIVLITANLILFNSRFKDYKPSIKYVKREYGRDLMNLGVKFFVLQIANIIQFQTGSFLIAHFFSMEQVTAYNIAYKYFYTLLMIFSILLSPLWSAVTDAYSKDDITWIKTTVSRYLLILIPFLLTSTIMLLLAGKVYDLWLGKDVVDIEFNISLLCYIFFSLTMFASIFVSVINGIGAIKIQFITSIFTPIGFILISLLLIKKFHMGIEAILISSIISNIFGYLIAPMQYYMIFIKKSKLRIWYK